MKVNFFAPINDLGFGIHSYNTIREFEKRGHQTTLVTPFNRIGFETPEVKRWLANQLKFEPNDPGIMIFNEEYLSQFCGNPRIGFPVFELETFTPVQIAMIKACDFVFTPTKWGQKILVQNGIPVYKTRIVNEGFDPEVFLDYHASDAEKAGEPFTFVHVGKFEARKGTLQMIECFFQALERETARLLLHIHNPFLTDYAPINELVNELGFTSVNGGSIWRRAGLSIHFSQPFERHSYVSNLYLRADCGLYPTRAEGWGLPILETLATGVPCVVGNWTGQTEYINADSYPEELLLVNPMRVLASDNMWFFGDRGHWNVPTDGQLMDAIRFAFMNARTIRKTLAWKETVAGFRQFTWERAALQLEVAIKDVCGL